MTVVDPVRDERGWAFGNGPAYAPDSVNGFAFLSEAYLARDPHYRGRVTVPVLWDKQTRQIVNNSDDDIMRDLECEFGAVARTDLDFYPQALRAEIDALDERIYETVNDGVYRAGFATSQSTVDFAHIKRHYYYTHDDINPRRIIPIGPALDLSAPHQREGALA